MVHVGLAVTQFAPSAVVKRGTSSKFTFLTTIRTSITGDSQFPAVDAVVYASAIRHAEESGGGGGGGVAHVMGITGTSRTRC